MRPVTPLLSAWAAVAATLGAGTLFAGLQLAREPGLAPYERDTLWLAAGMGAALCVLVGLVLVLRGRCWSLIEDPAEVGTEFPPGGDRATRRPYATLFAASFAALFLEVMLIRYAGAQIRIFAFYKNVPLVGSFLGLGLGCWLGGGRRRHALRFLLWLLPLAFALAQGSAVIDRYLGMAASAGSSEQVLGDFIATGEGAAPRIISQIMMGMFCAAVLAAVTFLFALLGRLLGDAFDQVPRLAGYTVNIVASLAGVGAFAALSWLQTPPWVWFAAGLVPLLWWLPDWRGAAAATALIAASCVAVAPVAGEVVWSPYQKLVGHVIPPGPDGSGTGSPAYLVQISDVFYQIAVDLRPAAWAALGRNPFPHYDGAFAGMHALERVLIVGAGTGNDVAAALRAGAAGVDAVDIDPAIVAMGRAHHPERPYDDPRVRVIVDDARRAFRRLPPGSYDAVVFGLLDSHTQLGISSMRLDNYVFTLESLASARRLLKPGGSIILTAATFRDWFRERFVAMLEVTCDGPVEVASFGAWLTYRCRVDDSARPLAPAVNAATLPTDDWPFLYMPSRGVPGAYLVVLAMLVATSVAALRVGGVEVRRLTPDHAHFFFLGAAFLLMEVVAINRLALLFGTTWLVSAVGIVLVLGLIVAANLTVAIAGSVPYGIAYAALALSLLGGYAVEPGVVLGRGTGPSVLYGLAVLLPVYFAGLVFARSFRAAPIAGPAIGANILGAVVGGWAEYLTTAIGIRRMALLALAFYAASLVSLVTARRKARATTPSGLPAPASS